MIKNLPISIFIITKNEEDRIENIIKRAKKISNDILIIDSGSDDKTTEIAKNLGSKIFFNKWKGYGPQKIFGENKCKNKWILNIDADEEITDELAEEIREIFSKNKQDEFIGYKIKIVNKFFGEKKPKRFAYYYNQLRLYNKEFAGFKNSTIHDSVQIKDVNDNKKVKNLKNIIEHQSFKSVKHWLEKINSYSSLQAQNAYVKKKKFPSYLKIIFTLFLSFFKAYFIRRYFIYGFRGVIYSGIYSFSRITKLIKIREFY